MTFAASIEFLRDLSILIAAVMGAYSIDAWRREHTGKRQIDLAEETLALFYEAREAISYIRSPMSYGHERQELERQKGESDRQYEARRNASVVFYRYDQRQDVFNRLYAIRYRFMAQFGREQSKPFDDLWRVRGRVLVAARSLARSWGQEHVRTEQQEQEYEKRVQRHEAVFWEGHEDPDEVAAEVEAAVDAIDSTCRAIIQGKGTLYGFLNWRMGRRS